MCHLVEVFFFMAEMARYIIGKYDNFLGKYFCYKYNFIINFLKVT